MGSVPGSVRRVWLRRGSSERHDRRILPERIPHDLVILPGGLTVPPDPCYNYRVNTAHETNDDHRRPRRPRPLRGHLD